MKCKLMFIPAAIAFMLPFQAEASSDGRAQGATSTQIYTTTLTGTLLAGAGFNVNLTGIAGASLGRLDANTRFIAGTSAPAPYTTANQITHVDAFAATPAGNLGDWSYSFALTAPLTPGFIDVRSIMLAYDNSGDTSGDLWNNTTFRVSVAAVPEASTMLQFGAGLASLAFVGWRRSSKGKQS
jgi:hypothetical protein